MLAAANMSNNPNAAADSRAMDATCTHGQQLQAIWVHSLDAILLTAPDGRIFAANPAACSLFGRTEEEICRLGRNGLVDVNDPQLAAALADREQLGQARRELIFIRSDGSRFAGEVTSAVFTDPEGQARTSMIIRDISERRRVAELVRDQALFPMLSPGPVLRVEPTGAISMSNPAAISAGLLTGINVKDVFPAIRGLDIAACIRDGTQPVFEAHLRDKVYQFTMVGEPTLGRALAYGTDITARLVAETGLREREAQYRSLFENSIMGISQALPDGRLLHVNQAYAMMYGYANPAEMMAAVPNVGAGLYAHPEDRTEVLAKLHKDGVMEPREFTLVRRDGSHFVALVSAREIRDATGRLLCYQAEHVDISARKEAEESLRENEQRLRVGLATTNIAVFNQDLNLRYTWMYQPQLGYSLEEVIGKKDFDLLPRAAAEQTTAAKREALAANMVVRREIRVELPRGDKIYDLIVEPLRNAAGEVTGITGASLDITDREQTAAALRQSQERLNLVMEAIHDGIWDWDLSTNRAYLSPRYWEMTGYRPDEREPSVEFFRSLVHPDDYPRIRQTMEEHFQGRSEMSTFDYRMVTKSGVIRWMLGRGRVVKRDAAGVPLRMVGTITDITDRKQAEAELAASQTALRALAARLQAAREDTRRHIARRLHDDLGHAFTDLKLDLAWLDRRLAERKLTKRTAARRKIAEMSQRVEADLNIARTLSTELRPAVLDTLGLAAALEWAAQQFENRTHITCLLDLPAEPPPLSADRAAALYRAFQEILSNVARHSGATTLHVQLSVAFRQLLLEVFDNGRGITAQQRDDPHALGLLGLRERALEFGGSVEISGVPGKGTRVRISIPQGTP